MNLYAVTNYAAGAARGHTLESAMAYLAEMDRIAARPRPRNPAEAEAAMADIISALNALGDGTTIRASVSRRIDASGKVSRSLDFSQADIDRAFAVFNGSKPQRPLEVRDGVTQLPRRF